MIIDAKSLNTCLVGLAVGAGAALLSQLGFISLGGIGPQVASNGAAPAAEGAGGIFGQLAGVLPSPMAPPLDYSQFKEGEILKAFKDRDFAALDRDETKTLIYLSGFHDAISNQGVIFYTDDQEIFSVVDPSLTPAIERKIATSSEVMNRTMDAGMGALMGMLQGMASARQSGGSVGDEMAAMNSGIVNSQGAIPVNQWKLEGEKDARLLAGKFTSNRKEFEQIYSGIAAYLNR